MADKKRNYSRPAIKKMLVVNSEAAINAAETFMKQTMSAIYALDVILYYISDEATTEQANQKIADIFDGKIKVFNEQISKYQQQADEGGLEEIEYTENHSSEYMIYSPLCGQYLQLIKKFDNLTQLIDQLWLNGVISSKKRNGEVVKLKRHLLNVSRQVINASRQAMILARANGQEKEVEETVKQIGVDRATTKDILNSSKNSKIDSELQEIADDVTEENTEKTAA